MAASISCDSRPPEASGEAGPAGTSGPAIKSHWQAIQDEDASFKAAAITLTSLRLDTGERKALM
jgi:hypothetical protein